MSDTKSTPPVLTLAEAEHGRKIIFENACSLLDEAKYLFNKGKLARSFALAKLAQEEFCKIFLLDLAAIIPRIDGDEKSIRGVWKMWRNHEGKSFYLKFILGPREGLLAAAKLEELYKLDALYVDYRDGKFSDPRQVITRSHASYLLEVGNLIREHMTPKLRDKPLVDAAGNPGKGYDSFVKTREEVMGYLADQASP
jgi:AbiV family abortive infection protein